ncbi:hypothetical protein PTB13_01360 [Bacillus sp. MHSD17]|nr:hypothetical protein [Bacillus sp. MHSD17]
MEIQQLQCVIQRQECLRLSRRPSGLRKTNVRSNSLAHRTTWLRSDLNGFYKNMKCT